MAEPIERLCPEAPASTLQGRRVFVLGLGFQATDVVLIGSLLFCTSLTVIFQARLKGAWATIATNIIVGLLFCVSIWLQQRASGRILKFAIRMTAAPLMIAYIFPLVSPLQLMIFRNWNDDLVLKAEHAVFGVQPIIWIEKFISPALTEWLMFSYIIYFILYPLLCGILYFKRGERGMEEYLFSLGLANFLCNLGAVLFPVAGPLFKIADQYTVPLKGYFFTSLGEYVRNNLQAIGSSLPSPHCASATVMWIMAYKYHRPTFYALSPIVISIYIATVYCRYHYVSDSVFGILTALGTLLIIPSLAKAWDRRADRQR